jgi:hypothetical protein
MKGSLHVGIFDDERDLLDAARECRARDIPIFDVVSPYPIHGIDGVLGIRRSRLAWVTLAGGAAGMALGFWLEYWTAAVNWPLNVGGKPLDSFPAFVPVAFELTILIAGLATAFGLFFRSRLWPGRRQLKRLDVTTDDRHALVLEQRDAAFRDADYRELLLRHGACEARKETEDMA